MSRFSNLEFGDESEDQAPEQKALVKDEAYYLAEARTAFENGNFESALRLYSKVLEFNPQNAIAWASQVRMLIELGEYREAKLWADKALERFPREPELLAAKAVALARSGDLQGALAFSDAVHRGARRHAVHLAGAGRRAAGARRDARGLSALRRPCCWRPGIGSSPGWRPGFAASTSSLRSRSSCCSRQSS